MPLRRVIHRNTRNLGIPEVQNNIESSGKPDIVLKEDFGRDKDLKTLLKTVQPEPFTGEDLDNANHKSLKWVFTQLELNMRQRQWVEFLQGFNYKIKFRPSKENQAADALSRRVATLAISLLSSSLPEEVQQENQILTEAHDYPLAAHPGYHKMFSNLKRDFFWPRMKKDTLDYVRRCLICQKTKAEQVKIRGKLQPLDIPQMKWECISMDFVTGLPKTIGNYDSIFVIVDKLTKVAHLIPVKQTAIVADIAQVFVKEIVKLHGIPAKIISDRDAKFTSKFWQAMFQSLGTQLNLSTAYHPETDGHTERVNQVIEDMLRAYCNQQPQKWIKFLHLVEDASWENWDDLVVQFPHLG
ncbi:hypothetical protein L7F22_022883 [Adiantum nelumboides]|nr:hypothetical protein [Adiantum nelumboides]MCO5569173.1 hypothetical protein [Adiantum nelumboides]